jgi:hypothetical protein
MQNIKAVRGLLLPSADRFSDKERDVLDSLFDYLVEDPGTPEQKMKPLLFELIQEQEVRTNWFGMHKVQLCLLTPEAVANVVKAIAYCFPDEFQLIPEIVLDDFRVNNSAPTVYEEKKGVHAMIIVTLLGLADNEAFYSVDANFNKPLMALLTEGLQKRYFRNSIIYSHQVSSLSSVLKIFIGQSHAMLQLGEFRWNALVDMTIKSQELFSGNKESQPGDTSLEYALINELCFKIFNTRSLANKVSMLKKDLELAG